MTGIAVAVTLGHKAWLRALPDAETLATRAIVVTLARHGWAQAGTVEVSVVLAADPFVRRLNRTHRGIDRPTNVLAFPQGTAGPMDRATPLMLGDVVLAYDTCAREAAEQHKRLAEHSTHLLVHGALHLLGYDHAAEAEALEMEAAEIAILSALGVADPYWDRDEAPLRRAS